jgi:dihydropteroate synthase
MFTLNCKGRLVSITQPVVMGIINLTPDSFYAGSRTADKEFLSKAESMINEGAFIIDIGGQSTRPGSDRISAEEECKRVIPAVEKIHRSFPNQLLSIDTFYSKVAREAVFAGAGIINDISAGSIDGDLIPTVAELNVPYVLMHMRGEPQSMQQQTHYTNVTLEVFDFLSKTLAAFTTLGIRDILIDPGFGFGKTIDHNFELLRNLQYFTRLERPLITGISRKATIYKTLQISAEEALNGTTVLHTYALLNGANILRAHDVKEAVQAIKLVSRLKE